MDTRQPRANWAHFPTRPMMTSAQQAVRQKLRLEVNDAGDPLRWTAEVSRGEKVVFVTRVVDPLRELSPVFKTVDTPMERVAREAYMGLGVVILGQGIRGKTGDSPRFFCIGSGLASRMMQAHCRCAHLSTGFTKP
jgi:hypothetical protein